MQGDTEQNKRNVILQTKGVCLLHDNARSHTANATKYLLDSFCLDIINHSAHSPDLTPSAFHLFTSLKSFMGGERFSTNNEVQSAVKQWTKEVAGDFFDSGTRKVIPELIRWKVTILKNSVSCMYYKFVNFRKLYCLFSFFKNEYLLSGHPSSL